MATSVSVENVPFLGLLRCVERGADGGACRGALHAESDHLTCDQCERRYSLIRGVPVLKPGGSAAEDDGWFESMYEGRDRTEELRTDYLEYERAFLADFAGRERLSGPSLEVGCGLGLFAEIMPGFIGLEYSLQSLMASGFESADRVCADATVLPFGDAVMECVFSINTLEHVVDVDRTFAEMDRVLKPGGALILKPAWHCTRYTTELIPVLPYHSLNLRQKFVKAFLPLLKSRPYKLATRLPWRLYRRLTARPTAPLRWGRLTPYHGEAWISDADAVANLDCHEGILYYLSRGYICTSHPTAIRQILAGHDVVVLRKPLGSSTSATA